MWDIFSAKFTAGDLVEGLDFLEPVERRATLFGCEQQLSAYAVVGLTYTHLSQLVLTALSRQVVQVSSRHPLLPNLFWIGSDAHAEPLFKLEQNVRAAFGGMDWQDLLRAYRDMVWIDPQAEVDHFLMTLRATR